MPNAIAQQPKQEQTERSYIAIDLKSFYASVECVSRCLDPLTTNLVVADASRTEKTICLAVSPSLKAFGISGRILSSEELKYVKHWENDYAFSVPIIEEALNRTIINTGRPSFEYAESILKRWAEAAVKNMDDIGRLDKEHEGRKQALQGARRQNTPVVTDRFHNFAARDYDMDELERKLLLKQN